MQDHDPTPQPFSWSSLRIFGEGSYPYVVDWVPMVLPGKRIKAMLRPRLQIRTSNSLPSILKAHAGIPSPVSKFAAGGISPTFCHCWPDDVWLKNILNVRVVWESKHTISISTQEIKKSKYEKDVHWVSDPKHLELLPSSSSLSNRVYAPFPRDPDTFGSPVRILGSGGSHWEWTCLTVSVFWTTG